MTMGNQPSQPPVNDSGQAVLDICTQGGEFIDAQAACCEKGELFYKPKGGGAPAVGATIPEELAGCRITQEEFSDGVDQINDQVKRLVPPGKVWLLIGLGLLIGGVGLVLWLLTSNGVLCDDESVKDYWRNECVEMDDDCNTRVLVSLDSFYPECRSTCLSNMTQDELLATANPDGGKCLSCPENDENEPTRGCQCVPLNDITRRSKCDYSDHKPGCMDFVKTRACDDEIQQTFVIGIVLFVIGHIVLVIGLFVIGYINKRINTTVTTLCTTLSSRSQTGTVWTLEVGPNDFRCIVINGVAKDQSVGQVNPVAVSLEVATVVESSVVDTAQLGL